MKDTPIEMPGARRAGLYFLIAALVVLLLVVPCSWAESPNELQTPSELDPDIDYLLGLCPLKPETVLDQTRLQALVEFIAAAKPENALHFPAEREETTSAYHEFDVSMTWSDLMAYIYDDAMPSYAFSPSTLRLTYWTSFNGQQALQPALGLNLATDSAPRMFSGTRHVHITPSNFSGSYYEYDIDKTLIAATVNGRRIVLEVTRMQKPSEVGKKGIRLGDEGTWDYLYSDEVGLTIAGLGWVKSYMYTSFAVSVFVELNAESPMIRYGTFKWLKAGWANLNVVKRSHIRGGMRLFGRDFKAIMEHPDLPPATELGRRYVALRDASIEELRDQTRRYLAQLPSQYDDEIELEPSSLSEFLAHDQYLNQLNRREMQAILIVQYMKDTLNGGVAVDQPSKPGAQLSQSVARHSGSASARRSHKSDVERMP
jgi:hypothetical protein